MTLEPLDRVVLVDWSAAARPRVGRDSIWVLARPAAPDLDLANPPTRAAATELLGAVLTGCVARGERVLVGWDLCLGFPEGFAAAAGLVDAPAAPGGDPPWRATAAFLAGALVDGPDNGNDRFSVAAALNRRVGAGPGPFWGVPAGRASTDLATRRPLYPVAGLTEHRAAERALQAAGLRPASPWQLLGAGSVGSQTLTGLPRVWALRTAEALAPHSLVWPFETGGEPPPARRPLVVHAEAWPRMGGRAVGAHHAVADADGLLGLATVLTGGHALSGPVATARLDAALRVDLDPVGRAVAVAEEGWVLGLDGRRARRGPGPSQPVGPGGGGRRPSR